LTTAWADSAEIPDRVARVRELQQFALARLPSMQLADGVFCHDVSASEGMRPQGRSLRYTLIVLIGLLRAEEHDIEHPFHAGGIRSRLFSDLGSEELTPGDIGLFLWAESRTDGRATGQLVNALSKALDRTRGMDALPGLEVAWILIGLTEALTRTQSGPGEELMALARRQLLVDRRSESGLLLHSARGPRRRFPNFASQIYGVLALAGLARRNDDSEAREAARRAGDKLLALQLGDGGWPWVFDAHRGTVVESYEIYSVHQDAMAPMGLGSLSAATDDERYRDAANFGLDWIWGRNELNAQMLNREAGILYRSIRRKEKLDRAFLYGRTAASYVKPQKLKDARDTIEVNRSDRPYHLGWVLEAWAGREDLAGS